METLQNPDERADINDAERVVLAFPEMAMAATCGEDLNENDHSPAPRFDFILDCASD